ncbi:osmoprotectant uptake system substrate-binding protein [Pokkaliibacter plantistimulans]|uniref:Osmoprotectant uptake system substrate-binding protein n=1 Tax=Pokkaliibacter plantistimulans TaxID=1635171 RepID=A0ABX5M2D5_9GAMM|nr:ABC transporter substrate-binding protein [Pokkaliibacter plantistimulans]PXF33070.1 osmoprotectant uptake system substrate-binding protein [Pokkaliibacter plantistimulans]
MQYNKWKNLLCAGLLGSVLASSGAMARDSVVVSSKIDTEGSVLGNMILLTLDKLGIKTENKIQLGATSIVRKALISGEIDIYPEYTGNGAFFYDMADDPLWKDADKAYQTVRAKDLEAHQLVWLQPANANNTWAISVRGDLSRKEQLTRLDQLQDYLAKGGDLKLAASSEFVESPSALPAFQNAYGFKLSSDQLVVLSGGNTAATLRAASLQTNGVNAAMAYGTDGGLSALDMVVLQDSKGVQPVYQPAPVIRKEVLDAHPQIAEKLNAVFSKLDLTTLQKLNADVAVNGLDPKQVAQDFLTRQGL